MYARLNLLSLKAGTLSRAMEAARGGALAEHKAQKGFKSVVFLSGDETDEVASFSLWETKEDAEAAANAMRPRMMEEIGGFLKGPPTTKLLQVHEPEA
ncbi:MAG: hypothetical protein ACE5JS_04545 [Nitrospinota bacterium]